MAAKLLHSLTDDNPDLQKQIGCMTGVFQLFDRHNMVAGRRFSGHSPKRLPPGSPQFDSGTPESESSSSYQRPYIVEKHTNKIVQDKHRASTESSRDSFSSMSRSSSFSSLDNVNRTTHPEPEHFMFPETPSRDSGTRHSCGSQISRQSLDLRDVVKDSMYREARGFSHKSVTKDEAPSEHLVNHRDPNDGHWYYNEPRELSRSKSYQFRDGSSFSVPKDCPRFSYDGRETNRLSFPSRDNAKTTVSKQPEDHLPRLSLDSRESSARSLNSFSRNPKTDSVVSVDRGSIQARPPSVVAKLMGLETLPDSGSSAGHKESGLGPIRTGPAEDGNSLSRSSQATDFFGPIKMHGSARSSLREPTSPCWKNSGMKPTSRFPMEPAPWKQREGARSPQRPGSRGGKSPTKIHSPYSSVYSEVDKRLKHLEFTESGKDLRALKQILEAMQSMEARKEGTHMVKRHPIATQNERFLGGGRLVGDQQYLPSAARGPNHSRAYESPIVIMKPAKLVERSGMGGSSVMHIEEFPIDNRRIFTNGKTERDPHPKSTRGHNAVNITDVKSAGRPSRTPPVSTKQSQLPKENAPGKGSGSVSPRLQQKRVELERRSRPPTPPPDSGKFRKPSTKQLSELSSPGGRRRPKYSNVQQNDDQYREVGSESKKLGYRETQEFNYDMVSKIDTTVISPEPSEEINNRHSPSSLQEKSSLVLREDESVDPEYPSPISVLDDAVYMDDSPSPVKHMLKTLKDNATQGPNQKFVKDQWESREDDTIPLGVTSEINRKKLQNIEHLVQKLTRLNSTHDEAHTDYIASLCDNTKPDDRYISEILLASGLLLRDLGSSLTTFQFHSSGHPINPELFLVLEQTKFSNLQKQDPDTPEKLLKKEKFHRKLIFDTVNEILAGKLALVVPSFEKWSQKPFKLAKKTLNAQKLLRELCSEIEQLQIRKKRECIGLEEEEDGLKSVLWEEVLNREESWTDYNGELPVIALEVERLIFKDLVNEVVLGEAYDGRRIKPGRRCRQLFSK